MNPNERNPQGCQTPSILQHPKEPITSLQSLPPEMLSEIFSHIDTGSRQNSRRVNSVWHDVISEIYEIKLELDITSWKILSKCTARNISLAIRGIASPVLSEAELCLGVFPLSERLRKLEFSGIVSYDNVQKAILFCHRLQTLSFYKIQFNKKTRRTNIASKARAEIYFQANPSHASLLPELKHFKFLGNARDPDELRLLHFLAEVLQSKSLLSVDFEFFRDLVFNFNPIESLLGNPPIKSIKSAPVFYAAGAEEGAVLKYDNAVESIIESNIQSLQDISVSVSGHIQARKLIVKFFPKCGTGSSVKPFEKFIFHDASLLHESNASWLGSLRKQNQLKKLDLDIFFNEILGEVPLSSFTLVKEIVSANSSVLTTIYLDCDFPEFREQAPSWDCRVFASCNSLTKLVLYHWQYHNSRWLGHFNEIQSCPTLVGIQFLPSSLQTFKTTLAVVLSGESLTEHQFQNFKELKELEISSIPWFLTAAGMFKRINQMRYNHLVAEMPKLTKLTGLVQGLYFDAATETLRQASAASSTFISTFARNVRVDWHRSVLSMEIHRTGDLAAEA